MQEVLFMADNLTSIAEAVAFYPSNKSESTLVMTYMLERNCQKHLLVD